jgi:hypothetical protein
MSQIARLLRLVSTLACVVIVASFALWAADEGRASSEQQIAKLDPTTNVPITAATPATPATPPPAEPRHGGVRGAIDDVNAALVGPFDGVVTSNDSWVRHGAPALIALLAYGLLLRLLINVMYARR